VDIIQRNVFVRMERDNLDDIPDYPLPPGYRLDWYAPGDEDHWLDIHVRAEIHAQVTRHTYHREFGHDAATLHLRQCFLMERFDAGGRTEDTGALAKFAPQVKALLTLAWPRVASRGRS
jgi:hypothetical protein